MNMIAWIQKKRSFLIGILLLLLLFASAFAPVHPFKAANKTEVLRICRVIDGKEEDILHEEAKEYLLSVLPLLQAKRSLQSFSPYLMSDCLFEIHIMYNHKPYFITIMQSGDSFISTGGSFGYLLINAEAWKTICYEMPQQHPFQ